MICFAWFRNRSQIHIGIVAGALSLYTVILVSCSELPPSYTISQVEGEVRAASLHFDHGFEMPDDCEIHGVCSTVLFGHSGWKDVVVTLECRCEKDGVSRYGQLVQNSYLVDLLTFSTRPGGEDRRKEEYRLQRGNDALDLMQYSQRDAEGMVARGTRIRFQGEYGQSPGLTQSDSGNRLAALSYNAFGRETYSLIPNPSHLIGYAHKGIFFVSVYNTETKREIGSVSLKYQGLPPESFAMEFYGDNILFRRPFDTYHGLIMLWPR